jgi:hypothetical protein
MSKNVKSVNTSVLNSSLNDKGTVDTNCENRV